MDDNFRPNRESTDLSGGSQRVSVNIGGTSAPVAPPAEPEAPPEAGLGAEPAPAPEPAPTPPTPGTVVTSGDGSIGGPPPQVVTANGGRRGRRWLKALIWLVILALLAVGGWFVYDKYLKKAPAKTTTQSKDIALLKIGMNGADYGNLYPNMTANEHSFIINAQIFEGLVRYEDKSKIVPELASDWTNPDNKTWVFTIRSGVKFHDGHTLTAADVKYSLDTIKSGYPDLAKTYADSIASVEVSDGNKVKITTTNPDPVLLNKLSWLYIIDANLPKGAEPSQAGTGPYEIKPGTTPTSTDVQMVAFNGYHGGKPQTRALDFGSADDSAALVKAFQAGKFNIIGPVPPNDAKKVKAAKDFVSSEPNVEFLGLNTIKPGPLQNKMVREAVRYAVNPLAIGQASDTKPTLLSQLIPESIPGYDPAIKVYKQDTAKAKQLLTQAGYPNGLTLRLSTANSQQQVNEIVSEFKQAGITVNVDQHNDFDEFINYFGSGQAEMYLVDYSSDTLDGLDIYDSTVPTPYYNNPQLTALLNQASTETDPAKRLKLLQQAATIVDQDVAAVPLYGENDVWLMDKNYALRQDMPSAYISVYFSKVHQQ